MAGVQTRGVVITPSTGAIGIYTWGLRAVGPRSQVPGQRVRRQPRDCPVFLVANHPAYLSREHYQSNLDRLQQQRCRGPVPGPARTTVAVLAGLVVCGPCGCRMQTHYTPGLRYECQRQALDYAAPPCQGLVGEPLEQLLATLLLQVVTPASLEVSARAAQDGERQRAALDRHWCLRLQRARQEADRAARQYHAVEPENRLVARTLEGQCEEALGGRCAPGSR